MLDKDKNKYSCSTEKCSNSYYLQKRSSSVKHNDDIFQYIKKHQTVLVFNHEKETKKNEKKKQNEDLFNIFLGNIGFLKGYSSVRKVIFKKHRGSPKVIKFLKSSKSIIENWYNDKKLYLNKLDEKFKNSKSPPCSQKTIDNYSPEDEKLFMKYNEVIWRNRFLLGFTHIIYQYKCKLKEFDGMSYFGYTDNFDRRLEEHVSEAIEPRRTGRTGYANVTKLHKAIREAFKLDPNYREYLLQGGNFTRIYNDLEILKGTGQYKIELNYIIYNIIKKYFELYKVEMTKGITITRNRENYYTTNYRNSDGIVKGTVGTIKYGLNHLVGGAGSGEDIPLPYIDIAAMLSLGISYNEIYEIITREYDIHIGLNTFKDKIKNIWGDYHEVILKFVLPVLEDLLISDLKYTKDDLQNLLGWSVTKFYNHFGSFSFLTQTINETGRLDILELDNYLETINNEKEKESQLNYQFRKMLRGKSLDQWKEWQIEGIPAKRISEELNCCLDTIYNVYSNISHLLIGIENASMDVIKDALRRKRAIQLLAKGIDPKFIVVNVFNLKSKNAHWRVVKYMESLFNMSYEQIMKKYYMKPYDFIGEI